MQIYETFVNQSKFGENLDLYRSCMGVVIEELLSENFWIGGESMRN